MEYYRGLNNYLLLYYLGGSLLQIYYLVVRADASERGFSVNELHPIAVWVEGKSQASHLALLWSFLELDALSFHVVAGLLALMKSRSRS